MKGTAASIVVLLLVVSCLPAQRSSFPRRAGADESAGSAPRRLFILGGFNERAMNADVCSISIAGLLSGEEAAWNHGTPLPKPLQGHAAVAVHGRVFVLGGLEGFTKDRRAVYSSDVFAAEAKGTGIGNWQRMKPLPHPLGYHAAVTYGDFIIVSGGQSPADVSAVYRASVTEGGGTGDWTKAGSLPKAMRGHASVIVGERLVVLGGHDDRGFFADAFSAPLGESGEIGEWRATTPLPLPLVHSGIAAHDGRIYVFGGQDAEGNLHAEVYSAEVAGSRLGDWRKETPFPVPQSRMTVHVVDEQVIVTGGGFGWAPPVYSAVFASKIGAEGKLGKWRKVGDLPGPLAFHAAVVCPNKKIYNWGTKQ